MQVVSFVFTFTVFLIPIKKRLALSGNNKAQGDENNYIRFHANRCLPKDSMD